MRITQIRAGRIEKEAIGRETKKLKIKKKKNIRG